MDDDDLARAATGRMLQRMGFTVTPASCGRDAIDAFRATPERFRVVLLDLTMPHMSGADVLAELRRLAPDVRVVLMSGYSENEAIERLRGIPAQGFLSKPFSAQALTSVLEASCV